MPTPLLTTRAHAAPPTARRPPSTIDNTAPDKEAITSLMRAFRAVRDCQPDSRNTVRPRVQGWPVSFPIRHALLLLRLKQRSAGRVAGGCFCGRARERCPQWCACGSVQGGSRDTAGSRPHTSAWL